MRPIEILSVTFLVFVSFGLSVLFLASWLFKHLQILPAKSEKHQLYCPETGHLVTCDLLKRENPEYWLEVQSCSIFLPPEDVACDQSCVRMLNEGTPLLRALKPQESQ